MAHNIKEQDHVLLAREKAWHGLGIVDERDGIPVEEAIAYKDPDTGVPYFDYPITKRQGLIQMPDGELVPVEDHYFTVREDTREVLGRVSKDYQIFSNRDVVEVMQNLVEWADLLVETVLTLDNGRRFVLALRRPEHITIAGLPSETTQIYLMATTTHGATYTGGGMEGFKITPTATRPVCDNTVTAALYRGENLTATIRHIGDMARQIEEVRNVTTIGIDFTKRYQQTMEQLVDMKVTGANLDKFLTTLVPVPNYKKLDSQRAATKTAEVKRARARIKEVILTESDLEPVRGTAYGTLQGVASFERNHRRYVTSERRSAQESRFNQVYGMSWGGNLTTRAGRILIEANQSGGKFKGPSLAERQIAELLADKSL